MCLTCVEKLLALVVLMLLGRLVRDVWRQGLVLVLVPLEQVLVLALVPLAMELGSSELRLVGLLLLEMKLGLELD